LIERKLHSEPLWERYERNRRKVAVSIVGFVLFTAAGATVVVTLVAAVALLVLALRDNAIAANYGAILRGLAVVTALAMLIGTAFGTARGLWRSERSLLRRLRATLVPPGELLPAKHALKEISLAAGLEHAPPLYIVEDETINAFAVGRRRERVVIGITRGLATLSAPDQRAVFANLLARVLGGDVLFATAVSSVIGPVWARRDRELRSADNDVFLNEGSGVYAYEHRGEAEAGVAGWLLLGFVWAFFSEVLLATHQRQTMFVAEAGDAAGMLLLKDPREALRGLETVLLADNYVRSAGEAYSSLFFCWAGCGYAPEDDPEMRRLDRLREVLGASGQCEDRFIAGAGAGADAACPPPPRLDEAG